MKTTLMLLGLGFSLFLATACGRDQGSEAAALGPRSSDLMRAIDCGAGASLSLQDATAADGENDLRHVPALDVLVGRGGAEVSFCDLLKESGKQLAIFQFAGIKCHSCLSWVEDVNAELGPYADAVLPVTIIIDDQVLLNDTEMASLKDEVAPDAVWTRDISGKAWSFFAPQGDSNAASPLTIVMDRAARGFFTSDAALTAGDLIDAANTSMSAGVVAK